MRFFTSAASGRRRGGGRHRRRAGHQAKTAGCFPPAAYAVWIGDVDADVASTTASASRALPLSGASRCHPAVVVGPVHCRTSVETSGRSTSWSTMQASCRSVHSTPDPRSTTDLILDVVMRGVLNGMRTVIPTMVMPGPRPRGQRRVDGGHDPHPGHGDLQRQQVRGAGRLTGSAPRVRHRGHGGRPWCPRRSGPN